MAYDYAIALTGGIATGKSTTSVIFQALGFTVIDADTIAHEVLEDQRRAIGRMFGEDIVSSGRVDRKALGQIVFSDAARRQELEALLHPLIQEEIIRRATVEDARGKPYFIDIPLFYERMAYAIERVALVYAPRELQITRLMAREGLDEAEVLQRLDAQMDIEGKRERATWVIDNTADLPRLEQECERVTQLIRLDMV